MPASYLLGWHFKLVWREFTAARKGRATHVASADLAAARPADAVDGAALALYDKENAFAAEVLMYFAVGGIGLEDGLEVCGYVRAVRGACWVHTPASA